MSKEYNDGYNKAIDDIKKLAKPSTSNYVVIDKEKLEELRK